MSFFGEVRFYRFCENAGVGAWLEFRARFVDGKLHGPIVLIKDTRPSSLPTPTIRSPEALSNSTQEKRDV